MQGVQVSIIVPVFNAQQTLEKCLQTIIHQTHASKELIVIDGNSTDGTKLILEQFRSSINVLVSEKDNGVYSAINKGITKAKGEWIYVLGADDCFADNDVLKNIFSNGHTGHKLILGSVINENASNPLVQVRQTNSCSSSLIWRNTMHQQGVFYKAELFNDFRFDENLKVLADYDFHLKLHNERTSFKLTNILIARCSAGGLSKQFRWSLYQEELRIKKKRLGMLLYLANIPWVAMKYAAKNLAGKIK